MAVRTVGSDQARLKMRDILDDVIAGQEVVIERYDKPTAVVIGYAQWQTWKKRWVAMLDEASQQVKDGEYATQEAVETGLRERGLID
jgi:antitoxin (DNA-binding transcriptional repressor) of toxin-antitoxin stability system